MEEPGLSPDLRDRTDDKGTTARKSSWYMGKNPLKDTGDMDSIQNRKLKKTLTRESGLDMTTAAIACLLTARFWRYFNHRGKLEISISAFIGGFANNIV